MPNPKSSVHPGPDPWAALEATFGGRRQVLYVAGPLRGDGSRQAIRHNQARMADWARTLQARLPQAALVVPHLNFTYIDEAGPDGLAVRAQVLAACRQLVARCDGLILCGATLSEGMRMERDVAEALGLPVAVVPGWEPVRALAG